MVKRSLATKQKVRVTLVSLAVICVFLAFLFIYSAETFRKDYTQQLERIFYSIELPLAQDVWNMDYDSIQKKLDDLSTSKLLSEADVIILGQYHFLHGHSKEGHTVPGWFAAIFRLPVTYSHLLYAPGNRSDHQLPIAQLVLKSAPYSLYLVTMQAMITLLLIFLLLALLQAAAISWSLNRLLIAPLKAIASAVNLMPKNMTGPLVLPAGHDDDELGALVKSYNRNQRALKSANQKLCRLSHQDRQTHLPNRLLFEELLEQQIANAVEQAKFSLLYLNINSMREITIALGTMIAEQLLIAISKRLKRVLEGSDILAYLDNNEFAILSLDNGSVEQSVALTQNIIRQLTAPLEIDGEMYYPSVNIGAVRYPNDGNNALQLLRHAQSALLFANQRGKNNALFFEPDFTRSIRERLLLENEIVKGMEAGEFILYLQPLMDMRTDRLIGAEALVRWRHEKNGLLSPVDFIPLAEETGLIVPLGQLILEQTCQYLADWQSKDIHIPISVNLAAMQIDHVDFPRILSDLVKRYHIDPAKLRLEITETGKLENVKNIMTRLQRLHREGFAIVLDDFGIGSSNLNYLRMLNIDTIKIDKSFTRNEQWQDKKLVKIISTVAKTFSITIVAEGVETEVQKEWLMRHEIYYGQGYFYDAALPKEVLEQKYLGIIN